MIVGDKKGQALLMEAATTSLQKWQKNLVVEEFKQV